MAEGRVGLGLIGCGQIAEYHLREALDHPLVRWVAVCDVRAEAAEARAAQFGVPGVCTRVEDLLADPAVDAVIVATSPTQHLGPTLAALGAGKHVLVEKPVALCAEEVEQMLAAQGDRVGACCSCRFRSTEAAFAATECLASGELGPVRRLCARIVMPAPADYDGTSPFFLHRPGWGSQGILADWSCYDFDYLLGLCRWRHEPLDVFAETSRLPEFHRGIAAPANDVEVQASALARLTDGVILDYRRAGFSAAEPENRWRVECEHGALDLSMLPQSPQVVKHRLCSSGVETTTLVESPYQWNAIHRGPIADFVEAIAFRRAPLTSLRNALTVQRLTDAIYRSAETGGAVRLPAPSARPA